MKIDFNISKSSIIVISLLVISYMFLNSTNDVTGMTEEIISKENKIIKMKKEIIKDKAKLKKWDKTIKEKQLKFIKGIKEFGIYHLMEYFDELSKSYPVTYKIKDKSKKLTKYYFEYKVDFTIKYEEKNKFKNLIKKIGSKYYCTFEKGTFKKNKFILTYNFYGRNKK